MPRLVVALYVADVLIALGFLAQVSGMLGDTGLIARQLHPGREANLPTWYSSVQWALVAGLLAAYALNAPAGLRRGWPLFLPVIGALAVSADEIATFHEWVGVRLDALLPGGDRVGTFFSGTGIWMLVLVPLAVAAAAWVAYLLIGHLRAAPSAARLLLIGGVMFLAGAGGVELLSNVAFGDRPVQLAIQAVEELGEMLGATTVVWGAFELLRVNGIRVTQSPSSPHAGQAPLAGSSLEGL